MLNFDKLTVKAQEAVQAAQRVAESHGHQQIEQVQAGDHRGGDRLAEALFLVVDVQQHVGFVNDADDLFVLHHRQLRHVVQLHALVGDGQRVLRADHHGVALRVRANDQVAQIAARWLRQKAVVEHPVVVVHLR